MSGPLDRGGTVVVRPSNDKRQTYTSEGASSSNSSVSKLSKISNLGSDLLVSNIRLHSFNHLDL